MSRADVHRFLLSDSRIAARITEILGARLGEMERRLGLGSRSPQVVLTHEQIAALVGASRETVTKVLGDFAGRGLIRLARGRVTLLDLDAVAAEAGD